MFLTSAVRTWVLRKTPDTLRDSCGIRIIDLILEGLLESCEVPFLICDVIMVPDSLHEKWRDVEHGLSVARDCAWAGFS